jgi:hypothetical protein
MDGKRPLRIANASGFYGDRLAAPLEMLRDGPIDVLTGDYLAELTMFLLWKLKQKDPRAGYATTFLTQMEQCLGLAAERGVKIVTNAGGLNPAGLADRVRELAGRLGLRLTVAHLEGDDLLPRLGELQGRGERLEHLDTGRPLEALGRPPVTANAYLGGWGIAAALQAGADVVVCGRVADASLVVGPAAWHFGWALDDWDRLAGAAVAGHVVECGTQCTGGNYAFFREVAGLEHPGFPIAEVHADGSSVITKHPGTGGQVSVGTVTAQLLYEIDGPRYPTPDVVARFDTVRLEAVGADRVRIGPVRGEPATGLVKVCLNYLGGYRNEMSFVLTGPDQDEKAALVRRSLFRELGGEDRFASVTAELRPGRTEDPSSQAEATGFLRVVVKDDDAEKVGRAFSSAAVALTLASYPGLFVTTPPTRETAYGVYWPALVDGAAVASTVVLDGRRIDVPRPPKPTGNPPALEPPGVAGTTTRPPAPSGERRRVPFGRVFGARSGDKGGNANVGVWARDAAGYAWLSSALTVEAFRELVPESRGLAVRRHELPNLRALNFVVVGLLGEGVASSTRLDPQGKALGEYLRSRFVDLPAELLR